MHLRAGVVVRQAVLAGSILVTLISASTTAWANCAALKVASTYNYQTGQYVYWYPPPGYETQHSSLVGRFWQLGNRVAANEGTANPFYFGASGGIGMNADLRQPGFIGCPVGRLISVAELISNNGQAAAFVAGTVDESVGFAVAFDYSVFGNQTLIPIPPPRITRGTRNGPNVVIDITVDSAAGGAFGSVGAAAINGYEIVDAVGLTSPGRNAALYTKVAALPGATGGSITGLTLDCSDPNVSHFVGVQLLFDSGVVSHYVSGVVQVSCSLLCQDADGDGYYGSAGCGTLPDCNDHDPAVFPGAPEICNLIDDNCDGQIDEGLARTIYRDADGDGYGDPANTLYICSAPPVGWVTQGGDCNDANAAIYPGAPEVCNGNDDDCNGDIDDGLPNCASTYLEHGIVMDNSPQRAIVIDPNERSVDAYLPVPAGAIVGDCAILPNGRSGYSTNFNYGISVFDLSTSPARLVPGENPILISNHGVDIATSSDGRFLVICGGYVPLPISVVDVAAGFELSTFDIGGRCTAVDVCPDGSVLVADFFDGRVRRLRLSATGQLTDTGESLSVLWPVNVYCSPDGRSGVALSGVTNIVLSFKIPGLVAVTDRHTSGSYPLSGAMAKDGSRFYVRNSATLDAFAYDSVSGVLGVAPLFSVNVPPVTGYSGIEQMALDRSGTKIYVPDVQQLDVFDSTTGARLTPFPVYSLTSPSGICLRPSIDPAFCNLHICDDGNPCTTDTCDPDAGCIYSPNTEPCDDGDPCTVGDACASGECRSGFRLQCPDRNPCDGIDACDPTTGRCRTGPPINCDDGNPCTDDSCDPATGCVHTPTTGSCDDGNPCTIGDNCATGLCIGTVTTGNPCDDLNPCTVGDYCVSGSCRPGTGVLECDDQNACTVDRCDRTVGCIHDSSQGGDLCDDGNPCTADACDPAIGCVFPPNPAGIDCTDFDPCTVSDRCDGLGNCVGQFLCDDHNACTDDYADPNASCACAHYPSFPGTLCNDGNPCTAGETCDGTGTSAGCTGGSPTNCDDGNPCTDDSCNPSSGCVHANNTAACNDGNACTANDTCVAGSCQGGPPHVCDDHNPCTDDSCNPMIGCVHANNTATCDDANPCTTGDTCGGGTCHAGAPVVCVALDQCHVAGACIPATGVCSNPTKRNGTTCDDGNAGTIGEACENGYCTSLGCQSAHLSIISGFNGTAIPAGRYVWFNASFKPSGIGSALTTLRFVNASITFKVGTQTFAINVPPSQIVFDPGATCATTSFSTALNQWETRVPTNGSDEIFLSGVGFPVPFDLPGGIQPVTWKGDVVSDHAGLSLSMKWGAAVYSGNMTDYSALGVKPMHTNSCAMTGSDHAGTPMNEKPYVVGGARGGGGSNFTGGWSGTQSVTLMCRTAQALNSGPVAALTFADRRIVTWDPAQNATAYDVLIGDVSDLRADGGFGGALCADDDLGVAQAVDDTTPEPGQCLYYVVRGDAVSDAAGTYDSVGPAPVGSEGRDLKIGTAAGVDCTHL